MASAKLKSIGFAGAATLVRSGPCFITGMKYINEDVAARFCQVFDAKAAAEVTVGTTQPDWILTAGANGGDDDYNGRGIVFHNGIVVAGTTTATGAGAAGAASQHFFCGVS